MKRKVLTLLSVSVMSMSLFACGNASNNKDVTPVEEKVTETEEVKQEVEVKKDVKSEPYIKKDISTNDTNISENTRVSLKMAKENIMAYGDIYSDFEGNTVFTNDLFSENENKVFTTRYNDLSSDTKNCLINDLLTCVKLENDSEDVKSEIFSLLSDETDISSTLLESIWVDIVLEN